MSRGPENRFIDSVHRLLKGKCHFEKMHNPYRGGTADVWYSGKSGDCWVEYKWLNRVPKRGVVKPKLEPLQRDWLRGRWNEGRCVFVIVGCPAGAMLFLEPKNWEDGIAVSQIKPEPKENMAKEILLYVNTSETINEKGSKRSARRTNVGKRSIQNRDHLISAVRVTKVSTKEKLC